MWDLDGAVAVVTGAGSGIGRALALELARAGCRLALMDLDAAGLAGTVELVGGVGAPGGGVRDRAGDQVGWTGIVDVADRDAVHAAAADLAGRLGRVDLVVNNAGIGHGAVDVAGLRPEDLHRVMDVNFFGVVHGTQAFLPHLVERPRAAVVNVSSVFGITAVGGQSAYCASKFAVRGFTESLRMELHRAAPHVRAITVHPGGVRTSIARRSLAVGQDPTERERQLASFERALRTSPAAAAGTIVAGVRRGRERILIGADALLGDALARLAPVRYTQVVLRGLVRSGLVTRPLSTMGSSRTVPAPDPRDAHDRRG